MGHLFGGYVSPLIGNNRFSYHEVIWLEKCHTSFKPVLYRRYVDTFLLFRAHSHTKLFFDYLNIA